MGAPESWRLARCPRCQRVFAICSRCDRGHVYCGRRCAGEARRDSVRRFVYIQSGRAVVEIDGSDHDLEPGDFVGFPTPSVPHQVRNPFGEELRYLTGGENLPIEIADCPRLDKQLIRNGSDVSIVSRSDLKPWGSG